MSRDPNPKHDSTVLGPFQRLYALTHTIQHQVVPDMTKERTGERMVATHPELVSVGAGSIFRTPLVTEGGFLRGLKYAPIDSISYTNDAAIARFADGSIRSFAVCWMDCSRFRSILLVQSNSGRASFLTTRSKAFFTEKKQQHAQELCKQVFAGWVNEEPPKLSAKLDSIDLPLLKHLEASQLTVSTFWGEKVTLQTIEGYAFEHLKSGYELTHDSWRDVTISVRLYEDSVKEIFPKIKDILRKEVHKRSPELRDTIHPGNTENCYNLDLFLFTILQQGIGKDKQSYLQYELRGEERERASGHWELRVDVPHDLVFSLDSLLLRTNDKNHLNCLREAAAAATSKRYVKENLLDLSAIVANADRNFDSFKNGIKDLMNQISLGGMIRGTCSICKSWETLA